MRERYKCGKCNRYIKIERHIATDKQMEEQDYPPKYYVPICKKCGKLQSWEVEIEPVKNIR
jgi:uncharacterized protein with PIN domain